MGFLEALPEAIWVGTSAGRVVVYDPGVQLPDYPYWFLWEPTSRVLNSYLPSVVGKLLTPLQDPAEVQSCAAAYEEWRRERGKQRLREIRSEYDKWLEDRRLKQEKDAQVRLRQETERHECSKQEQLEREQISRWVEERRLARAQAEQEHWERREAERLGRDRMAADAERRGRALSTVEPDACFITLANSRAFLI